MPPNASHPCPGDTLPNEITTTQRSIPPPDPIPRPGARRSDFLVVGVVSSAGGLDALKKLLAATSAAPGMAFVLVPHLDPDRESLMPELLAGHTPMPVAEATDGVAVAVDHVYITPPNITLTIRGGILRRGPPPAHASEAIDAFLTSLAEDQGERAVGVVLSGTGSHGARGLREIKARGGRTVVQEPATAAFPAMPQAAIEHGLADHVLPVEQFPAALAAFAADRSPGPTRIETPSGDRLAGVMRVMDLVLAQTGHDFRAYRSGMLARRVERRAGLKGLPGVPEYLRFVGDHPEELNELVGDLMIGVTRFFRDPEAFGVLEAEVIPAILGAKQPGEPARVWVPACATGEEAYSLAMLFLEQSGRPGGAGVQVFATDIDPEALAVARHGAYSEAELTDVRPDRRNRFFTATADHTHKVVKPLREAVVFGLQNLLSDPPYARIDLISCRNLLIYLEPAAQQRILSVFALALNPGGYLILGPSEALSGRGLPFEPVSGPWRIFRRTSENWTGWAGVALAAGGARPGATESPPILPSVPIASRVAGIAAELLLAEYAPAAALIDQHGQALYLSGPTGLYLELPTGALTQDLQLMARRGLRGALRKALARAREGEQPTAPVAAWVKRDEGFCPVRVSVRPVPAQRIPQPLFLVVFEEAGKEPAGPSPPAPDETLLHHLERELRAAEEDLRRTNADQQTANEGLTAANEEMTSVNEELRSAVEELESSKEELQSLNEELTSTNAQLHDKAEALTLANVDIANLLNSTDLAAVFVGPDGLIRRFTPTAARLFRLIPADVGRPLTDIAPLLVDRTMHDDLRAVIRDGTPVEREVSAPDSRWYLRRALPYRAADDRIDGAILTYSDVTLLKQAEIALRRNKELARLAAVLVDSADAIAVIEFDGRITAWNRGAERLYGYAEAEALRLTIQALIPGSWRASELAVLGRVGRGEPTAAWETQRVAKDGRVLDVSVSATLLRDEAGAPAAVSTTERDVTGRKQMERDLQERNDRVTAILGAAADGIITMDGSGVIESVNPAAERIFGYAQGELDGRNVATLIPSRNRTDPPRSVAHSPITGESVLGVGQEVVGLRKDGSTFPADLTLGQIDGLSRFVGIVRDTTRRKQLEREVLEISAEEQMRMGRELHDTVGQELTGLRLMAETHAATLRDHQSPDLALALRISEGMREALGRVRTLSHGLIPASIGGDGLGPSLANQAAWVRESAGIACTFEQSGGVPRLDPGCGTHLLRIAQEAVTNAIKHASPRRIAITLAVLGESVELRIADDGCGFRAPDPDGIGLGVKLMRYRAGLIGAAFHIESEARGTRVSCTLRQEKDHDPNQREAV